MKTIFNSNVIFFFLWIFWSDFASPKWAVNSLMFWNQHCVFWPSGTLSFYLNNIFFIWDNPIMLKFRLSVYLLDCCFVKKPSAKVTSQKSWGRQTNTFEEPPFFPVWRIGQDFPPLLKPSRDVFIRSKTYLSKWPSRFDNF